ncbi:ABC transporter ATP-binding protein [Peptococcus simiae]|uniref:ABC transporter ATP-binding protein n=1 Tax=Peptococcus simiae TaxID=1643805 RepID=A0ABW9GWB2_9FIRM
MLELQNIGFGVPGKADILKNINLTIKTGETVVVTGPNGGGKTSLAKVIAGVAEATAGRIILDGEDISDLNITDRARTGIAYAFQQPVRFKGLRTRDLLNLSAGRELSEEELADLLRRVGLQAKEYVDRSVDTKLSGGEIKRIEIAGVMARDAKLFVFDEPEAGIDLWSFNSLIDVFNDLRENRRQSTVIISHQERILEIADRIAVIVKGELAAFGPTAEILPRLAHGPECQSCSETCLVNHEGEEVQ